MGTCLRKKETNKKKYFDLLQKTIKKNYDKNHYNTFNLAYSLHINKFTKRRNSTRLFYDNSNSSDITWKDYLLQKLEPSPIDLNWKKSLFNFVSKEPFLNQYFFQNKIFFEEFAFLTKPKLNKKEESLNLSGEPILSSLDTKELKSLSKNISTLSQSQSLFEIDNDYIDTNEDMMIGYEQHLNMNITIESITSSMIKKDPKYESQLNSYKVKLYIQIFKRHLDNKNHPLNIIINKFIDFFIPYLRKVSAYCDKKKEQKEECLKKGKEIIRQIQNFIEIMQVVLKLFYSKSINYRYFVDEKDEIINLISYILFNVKKIYNEVSNIFSAMNNDKITKLKKQFEKLGDITPREIGINPKFCLDKETEKYMMEIKNKNKNKIIY